MEQINKIVQSNSINKIDELLEFDRDVRDLGKDHTKAQKTESRRCSEKIYKAINGIDPNVGSVLLKTIDKY